MKRNVVVHLSYTLYTESEEVAKKDKRLGIYLLKIKSTRYKKSGI